MTSKLRLVLVVLFAVASAIVVLAVQNQPKGQGLKAIASGRVKHTIISLKNPSGSLTVGENQFCVLFYNSDVSSHIDVQDLRVDFRQQVGKIQEAQISAKLTHNGTGLYCGHVDLGRQFYKPSAYYIFIHYMDVTGKKKARLFASVK